MPRRRSDLPVPGLSTFTTPDGTTVDPSPAEPSQEAEEAEQDADEEYRRLLTFDGRPRLHVPLETWRMYRRMHKPITSADVDDALTAMELAIQAFRAELADEGAAAIGETAGDDASLPSSAGPAIAMHACPAGSP